MKKLFMTLIFSFALVSNANACGEEYTGVWNEMVKLMEFKDGYVLVENVILEEIYGYTIDLIPSDAKVGDTLWVVTDHDNHTTNIRVVKDVEEIALGYQTYLNELFIAFQNDSVTLE